MLIGRDGNWVGVEPTLWSGGTHVCQQIRDRIPSHLLVDHGARPDEMIPKPPYSIWRRVVSWLRG